jgi:hypothetical protein
MLNRALSFAAGQVDAHDSDQIIIVWPETVIARQSPGKACARQTCDSLSLDAQRI